MSIIRYLELQMSLAKSKCEKFLLFLSWMSFEVKTIWSQLNEIIFTQLDGDMIAYVRDRDCVYVAWQSAKLASPQTQTRPH